MGEKRGLGGESPLVLCVLKGWGDWGMNED